MAKHSTPTTNKTTASEEESNTSAAAASAPTHPATVTTDHPPALSDGQYETLAGSAGPAGQLILDLHRRLKALEK